MPVVREALKRSRLERWRALGPGFKKAARVAELLTGEPLPRRTEAEWLAVLHWLGRDPARIEAEAQELAAMELARLAIPPGQSDSRLRPPAAAVIRWQEGGRGYEAHIYSGADSDPLRWLLDELAGARVRPDGVAALTEAVEAVRTYPANPRPDPILPVVRETLHPDRERGRLLGGLVPHMAPQERLPLFPDLERARTRSSAVLRVPLLELADRAGVVSMAKGRGAPLALRLTVESVLSVSHELRDMESVRIVLTVGELMAALKPRNRAMFRDSGSRPGDWDRVRTALMEANERWIPWNNGGRWWLLRLRAEPGHRPRLTDPVVMEVALPPGSGSGPVIDRPALRAAGVRSGPEYRALLGVQSVNWIPGRTRLPKPVVGGLWIGERRRYPVLTAEDRRRIAFGPEDSRSQPKVDSVFRELPGIEVLETEAIDESGRKGWRVVPERAAAAIRKADRKRRE